MPYKNKDQYNEYLRKYMIKRWEKRRASAIAQLGGKCVSCESMERLEFDHIFPALKSFNITNTLKSASEKRFQSELAKCQLLCNDCHKKKTKSDRTLLAQR